MGELASILQGPFFSLPKPSASPLSLNHQKQETHNNNTRMVSPWANQLGYHSTAHTSTKQVPSSKLDTMSTYKNFDHTLSISDPPKNNPRSLTPCPLSKRPTALRICQKKKSLLGGTRNLAALAIAGWSQTQLEDSWFQLTLWTQQLRQCLLRAYY